MSEDIQAVLDAGHQCDVATEGYYWARLIIRTPPRHLPQAGPYPKLCLPAVVRLLLPSVGRPLVLSTEARGRVELTEWIFLAPVPPYATQRL